MGSDSNIDYGMDPGSTDFGGTFGGYPNLVEQNPGGVDPNSWLNSILDPYNGPSYAMPPDQINPYTGQSYGMAAAAPYLGSGNSGGGGSGLSLGKILGGLGGLATALGPALGAAGQLAMNALNQRPFFRPTPFIQAGSAHTTGGETKPLSLGGQVVTNDPLTNYAKLLQGMR